MEPGSPKRNVAACPPACLEGSPTHTVPSSGTWEVVLVEPNSQLVLIRHGETEWSRSGQHTGRTDIPLTEEGRRVAAPLRARLARYDFAAVYSSPLRRAVETAQIAGLGERAQLRPELMEWDYGDYEGLVTAQIREREPGWTLWTHGVPHGETAAQVAARVDRLLAEVRSASGPVALFAHGHVLRVLAARYLGLPPTEGRLFALGTASISVLARDGGLPVLELWNDQSHLAPAASIL